MKKKFYYLLISFILTIILLWILLSKIETEELSRTFQRIFFPAILAYMAVALAGALLRAWRYKWLLRPQAIGWGNILMVTFVRNSFIDLLPARLGSLIYVYLLNRRLNFPFEVAASTFVLAAAFDFLTLSPFLFLAIFIVSLSPTGISTSSLLVLALIFFLIVFLILWKIVPFFSFLLIIYRRIITILKVDHKNWAKISVDKVEATIQSFNHIRERKIYFPVFFLSLFIRLAKYISLYFLLFSLLRTHGYSLHELSFWKLILGITGAELTSVLPVKGIAGFGTWESAWTITYKLMNFEQSLAIISGIGVHLLSNIFEYSLGIASLLILALPFLKKSLKF